MLIAQLQQVSGIILNALIDLLNSHHNGELAICLFPILKMDKLNYGAVKECAEV